MKKLEIYKGNKTYMYPTGALAFPQIMQTDFPAILTFPHVIETDDAGQVCYAVLNLSALRSQYSVDTTLTDEAAVIELEEIINAPEPSPEPTAEERIAAAMEFSNMVALSSLQ